MMPATMKTSSTGPAACAAAQSSRRSSGSEISWIQRGTTTLGGPLPSCFCSVLGSSSGKGLYPTTKLPPRAGAPCAPGPRWTSGLALALSDLGGLVLDVLLRTVQLVLGLALPLLLTALATHAAVAGHVAGGLLRPTGDLVQDAHSRLLYGFGAEIPVAW